MKTRRSVVHTLAALGFAVLPPLRAYRSTVRFKRGDVHGGVTPYPGGWPSKRAVGCVTSRTLGEAKAAAVLLAAATGFPFRFWAAPTGPHFYARPAPQSEGTNDTMNTSIFSPAHWGREVVADLQCEAVKNIGDLRASLLVDKFAN